MNGVESPVGAAEYEVEDGDRIWWDHRDWSTAMRVPAVVGSWPEPFLHGSDPDDAEGESWGAGVFCGGARSQCALVNQRLERARGSPPATSPARRTTRLPRTRSASWSVPGTRSTPTPWRALLVGRPAAKRRLRDLLGGRAVDRPDPPRRARPRRRDARPPAPGLVAALRAGRRPADLGRDRHRRRRGRRGDRAARAKRACATATRPPRSRTRDRWGCRSDEEARARLLAGPQPAAPRPRVGDGRLPRLVRVRRLRLLEPARAAG